LTVETNVTSCERFSMVLEQKIFRGQDTVAVQKTKIGFINLEKKRPFPIPDGWRSLLLKMKSSART
ncbi:MAG: hypothetical protein PF495_09805, partial [Spirochaetales bacterium]|nr:hypothetical protein [Spirochaetales bacterium]